MFDLQTGDRGLKHLQVALAALLADQTVERAALAWSSCGACFSAVCHESKLETSTTAGGHYTGSRFELRVSYKGVSVSSSYTEDVQTKSAEGESTTELVNCPNLCDEDRNLWVQELVTAAAVLVPQLL